jgi:hypothetical protein
MEQVYCELHESTSIMLKMSRYVTYITDDFGYLRGKGRVVHGSERIWLQCGNRIRFVKNRHSDLLKTKVDMEEFMWIKLKSIQI